MIAINLYIGSGGIRIEADFNSVAKALLQELPCCLVEWAPQEEPSHVMDGYVKRLQESCGFTLEIGFGGPADLYEAPEFFIPMAPSLQ